MNNLNPISLTPEHSKALADYEHLKEALLKAEGEKEHLIHQAIPDLNANYLSKVGKLKLELLEVSIETYRLKRKMELIQSCINRQSEIVIEAIDVLLETEIREQRKKLDEESKKLEEALRFISIKPMDDKDASELRNLYYKLARILHPDVNPVQDESSKLLWLKVSEAYQAGDLQQMKLLEVLTLHEVKENSIPGLLKDLNARIELFSSRLIVIMKEIEHIKTNFPFTHIEKLNEPAWIEMENNESLNAIAKATEEKAGYEKAIQILLESEQT